VVKTFIENLLPKDYLMSRSNVVKNYRLRGNKSVELSFEDVLSKPFFSGEKVSVPLPKPQKPVVVVVPPTKTYQSPVNKEAAKGRAVAILKAGKMKPKKRPGIVRVRP
jgi:hypothetical protein